jgi:glycosyltransferase involved in cell wall biosynthesis
MPARAALLTPFASPSVRGNAITVTRIARGLAARGVEVRVWDHAALDEAVIEAEVEAFAPSLVHAFHAWRVGPVALRIARRLEVPLVVTLTGTDANYDLFDAEHASTVRRVLEAAARTVAFHGSIVERVAAALPDLRARLVVIPQAVDLAPDAPFDVSAAWPELSRERMLFVFPAGIRPVKRPRMPLRPFATLVARHPHVRLLYVGPAIQREETDALEAALAPHAWARYVGAVPHAQMASLLSQADAVLNCSESEGGMANSVLEALACARPVLAADIEGNRSLVEHEVTGLLFRDEAELGVQARRLVCDSGLRARLGAAGQARVRTEFPASRELDGYLAVYDAVAPAIAR